MHNGDANVTSINVTSGAESQRSVAVTVPVVAGAVSDPHSNVVLDGQNVITGGVVSSTTIVWTHELLLPQASVATQVFGSGTPEDRCSKQKSHR